MSGRKKRLGQSDKYEPMGFRMQCHSCRELSPRVYDQHSAGKWAETHFDETGHDTAGVLLDNGLSTRFVKIEKDVGDLLMSAKDKVVGIDSKKPKEQEDLKTELPQEELRQSLGSIKSDMVKKVESERIGKQVVDPREDGDVL